MFRPLVHSQYQAIIRNEKKDSMSEREQMNKGGRKEQKWGGEGMTGKLESLELKQISESE